MATEAKIVTLYQGIDRDSQQAISPRTKFSAVSDENNVALDTIIDELKSNKILWSGAEQMASGAAVYLSELVSEQSKGIVLIFSRCSGTTIRDYDFHSFFIPKQQVANHIGTGMGFMMSDFDCNVMAKKYLYVHNTGLTGYAKNNTTVDGNCGINWTNDGFVLRYVIGV